MLSFKTFQDGWNHFFYRETDGRMLALFRIFLGFFMVLNAVSLIPDLEVWYGVGTESVLPVQDSFYLYSGFRINLFKILSPTLWTAQVVLFIYLLSSFTFMVGLHTRLSAFVSFILLVSLQNRNYAILNSGDTLMRCLMFLMVFAPTFHHYSIDAMVREKKGVPFTSHIPILTLRLIQLQFTLVYLATTYFKLKGLDWVDGTVVYYTSRLENFQRVRLPILFDYLWLVKTQTWVALFIEFAMGSLIWVREWRRWVLLSGVLLHLMIEITMSIGFFEWIMMCTYVLFLEKGEYDYLKEKVRGFLIKIPGLGKFCKA